MKILSFFQITICANLIKAIISLRYPINHDLDNSTGVINLIEIESKKSFNNYTKEGKALSLFFANFCKYCKYLLDIFKWASTYNYVSDWKFLTINCTEKQLLCHNLNITRYPKIKTYINKTELPYKAPFELIPLLEYLIKLSAPSLIEINGKMTVSKFYADYGYFSPIIEYKSKDNQFYKCIKNLSEKDYKTIFYLGMNQISYPENNDNHHLIKEKIIIDNNGAPFIYIWDNNCSNIDNFLKEHIFPLITIINNETTFFYEVNKAKKILVMLFGYLSNNKIQYFFDNYYKYLDYEKNKYIFCFLNYTNTKQINHYFSAKLYADSELKLIIFDFNKTKYYSHQIIYDVNFNKPEEIISDFNIILSNLTNVYFTTGYFLKDLLNNFGINEITKKFGLILALVIILITVLVTVSCTFFCKKFCPSEIEENFNLDDNLEKNNSINNEKTKLKND